MFIVRSMCARKRKIGKMKVSISPHQSQNSAPKILLSCKNETRMNGMGWDESEDEVNDADMRSMNAMHILGFFLIVMTRR